LIRTKHPAKGKKGGQRERRTQEDQDRAKSTQTQREVIRGQSNKLCFRVATSLQEVYTSEKERKGKLESVGSLEEPSLATKKMMMCFKIEAACA
jgi:hypothetical protein